jgi:hypothetical protein
MEQIIMRWLNRDRSPDAGGGIENDGSANNLLITSDANNEEEEALALGRHESKRRFLLFRRRRSDLDTEIGEKERGESDQDSAYANTTLAAVATGLTRQKVGTSLLDGSNDEISNRVDEGSIGGDQSTDTNEIGFNWFGLLKNNGISSREKNKRRFEYASIDNITNMVMEDGDESINAVDNATTEYSTKPRFNWFGLLQPSHNPSSCVENVAFEFHSAVNERDEEEKEEKDKDDDGVCSGEGFSQYDYDGESSAEVSDKKQSDDSMDTHDIVLDISDDERLQALFDKRSAQRSDQQDEQQRSCCEDNEQFVAISHIMNNNNTESEFFVNKETLLSDEILALWNRRQRLKRKLQIGGPIVTRESAQASVKMLGTSQIEAGGGRNEENMRSLELESQLIDTNSNYVDRKMAKMEIMIAEEKEREDLLYDLWLQDMCEMAGEEPEYGYDKLGWYSTLTQREDGEADLEYMNSFAMNVATEDDSSGVNKSNRWLEGLGNAALFIFAPDLYFIQQMNESSFQPQYHATSNKEEEEEQDRGQKQGWFKKLFTNEGRRRDW